MTASRLLFFTVVGIRPRFVPRRHRHLLVVATAAVTEQQSYLLRRYRLLCLVRVALLVLSVVFCDAVAVITRHSAPESSSTSAHRGRAVHRNSGGTNSSTGSICVACRRRLRRLRRRGARHLPTHRRCGGCGSSCHPRRCGIHR